MKQNTDKILMIRPTNFGFNEEAFKTNSFQERPLDEERSTIQNLALQEFETFVEKLRSIDVEVIVFNDRENSTTPDSIFPNNWISTHQDGKLLTYPMAVSNRRSERRLDIVQDLVGKYKYDVTDLSFHETENNATFLEGTGSILFDHISKVMYGAISPRTNQNILKEVGALLDYTVVPFSSLGKSGELIYHTNVMLCIGKDFACIGVDTIIEEDKQRVIDSLASNGKEIIELTNNQVYNHFAGNMLQIENRKGESILVMSQSAYNSLDIDQLAKLEKHNDHLLSVSIPTIERIGGGSVRCMLAEIFIAAHTH